NKITSISGAFMEDKGLSLSLHYRLADKKQIPLVKTIFHETVIVPLVRDKIAIRSGKMVLEVRPPVAWDKGRVVLWLLARQRFAVKDSEVLPVYIGDDVSDEDAFKALENKGLTVFVGAPKASSARYYLKDSGEVVEFLRRLSEIS
ncbi:MAG: trehalose-phosphatase, partial [Deltaproteobacteria bacterium]